MIRAMTTVAARVKNYKSTSGFINKAIGKKSVDFVLDILRIVRRNDNEDKS